MLTRFAINDDIPGISDLQEKNLFENLSESEMEDGFVTTPFTTAQLEALLVDRGIFVAVEDGEIMGYAMAASWEYCAQWPIFPYMLARLAGSSFADSVISYTNSYQYGPVCIDSELRGTDLFPRLFEEMRIEFSTRYPVGITFINQVNQRSYEAHTRKIGMAVVDTFEFSGRWYYSLAFDTARSVFPSL